MNQTLRHLAEALAPSLGRRPHGRALTPTTAHTVLPTVSHACGLSPTAPAHVLAGHFIDAGLPDGWAPARQACITPPPAPTPRTLTLKGGFTVIDSQQRRLHCHAHTQGYGDLAQLPPSTLPPAGQPRAAGQRARHHHRACPPPARPGRDHPVTPPGDRRPHATQQHRPAPRCPSGGAGLRDAPGLPDQPGDDTTIARHHHSEELGVHPATCGTGSTS